VPLPETLKLRAATDRQLKGTEQYWGTVWNYMMTSDDIDGAFAKWYPVIKQQAGTDQEFMAKLAREYLVAVEVRDAGTAPRLDEDRFAVSMHSMGVASFKAAIARGESPERAMAIARSLSWGSYSRFLMDAQRQVIMDGAVHDPGVRGWRRVGFGGCDFCDMLIDRGAVYTQATAFFASHDRCRCSAEPENDSSPFFTKSIDPDTGRAIAVDPERPKLLDLGFPPIEGEHSWTDDADEVNMNYEEGGGWRTNCWSCTHAYELRRRGYDVVALPEEHLAGHAFADFEKSWKPDASGFKRTFGFFGDPSEFYAKVAAYPDGARGAIGIEWRVGGAHILNWEKVDGQVKIIDSQIQEEVSLESIKKRSKGLLQWIRTDDLVPSARIKQKRVRENRP
jgi:Papain fold toxin 1, glutamine deamidase